MSLSQAKICEGLTITYNSLLLKNGVDFSKGKTLFSLPSFAREGPGMGLNPLTQRYLLANQADTALRQFQSGIKRTSLL